jgi:hypothetical protein
VARGLTIRLTKLHLDGKRSDDDHYDCWRDPKHGWQCTCEDFAHRRERRGEMCKHLGALQAVGLLA